VGSPFDYPRQAVIHLPRAGSLPDPSKQAEAYEEQSIEAIPCYLEKTQGKAFVLFTSWKHLSAATNRLRPWIEQRPGWKLFSQSDGLPRERMIELFLETHADGGHPVLFGTDSFWGGVDVPGEALSQVVIMRIPFRVPDHPLLVARMKLIDDRGGNSFMDYAVPEACIKLKQAFGRLIRSKTDRGIVVILDPRITTKPYGRTFLASLPDCKRVIEHLPALEEGERR
jgi:ATP-dependent DNA helicase DinG